MYIPVHSLEVVGTTVYVELKESSKKNRKPNCSLLRKMKSYLKE